MLARRGARAAMAASEQLPPPAAVPNRRARARACYLFKYDARAWGPVRRGCQSASIAIASCGSSSSSTIAPFSSLLFRFLTE